MIEQLIVNKILEVRKTRETIIVAFCGAADLGKTYLAKAVVQLLNSYEISSAHLGLDSFLMNRTERKRKGISGYDPKAHDIQQIVATLRNWRAAKTIKYYAYDHQAGEKTKDYTLINDCEVLLIEGLFALHESILPFVDLSFFFYTNDEILQQIKLASDLVKRGYTPEYSRKIYQAEFELYKQHIETMSEKANYRLLLQDKWQYLIEKG